MSESVTTAEIIEVFLINGGAMYGFAVYTDREHGKRGLTKGRKVGMLVSTTLPDLLRDVAGLIESNGGTWEGLVEVLEDQRDKTPCQWCRDRGHSAEDCESAEWSGY